MIWKHRSAAATITLVAVLSALAGTAGVANADGGASIAAAPTVTIGQQEFGNLANGSPDSYGYDDEYWLLPVTAGDHVRIDWETATGDDRLLATPVGTSDYTIERYLSGDYGPVAQDGLYGNNLASEVTFTAPSTGTMPLAFGGSIFEEISTYDFTVYIQHRLILSLAAGRTYHHVTNVTLGIHTPDGAAVPLASVNAVVEYRSHGRWSLIGAVPSDRFSVRWSRRFWGVHMSLRVRASGPDYLTASATVRTFSTV